MNSTAAQQIAADWHGGQWTDLYRFASTAHLGPNLVEEITDAYRTASPSATATGDHLADQARNELLDLLAYVSARLAELDR